MNWWSALGGLLNREVLWGLLWSMLLTCLLWNMLLSGWLRIMQLRGLLPRTNHDLLDKFRFKVVKNLNLEHVCCCLKRSRPTRLVNLDI